MKFYPKTNCVKTDEIDLKRTVHEHLKVHMSWVEYGPLPLLQFLSLFVGPLAGQAGGSSHQPLGGCRLQHLQGHGPLRFPAVSHAAFSPVP